MKEHGIIFNAEMVRAILDGRKTQTRRIMKVQPESNHFGVLRVIDSTNRKDIGKCHWAESNATGTHMRSDLFPCPFGEVGDRLWVRETFALHGTSDQYAIHYRANHPEHVGRKGMGYKPSIHMPRWASRITLEVTGLRAERLRDISESDAKSEGIFPPASGVLPGWEHRIKFRERWMSIYGVENWEANPWVWVVEFKRVEG